MSEDRIVHYCDRGHAFIDNDPTGSVAGDECPGGSIVYCGLPLKAINIDALIRERDDLKRRLQSVIASAGETISEVERVLGPTPATCCQGCKVEMADALNAVRGLRAALDLKDGE